MADDPHAAIAKLFPPCRGCDRPFEVSIATALEMGFKTITELARSMLDTDARLLKFDSETRESMNRMACLCEQCYDIHVKKETAQTSEARRRKRIHNCYARGLMPSDARDWTFENNVPEYEAENHVLWLIARTSIPLKKNLWLEGLPGLGKTRMARCILNETLERGYSAGELNCISLNVLANGFEWQRDLTPWLRVHTLLLDDLDKPSWSARGLDALWWLLDKRANLKKVVITTANADKEKSLRLFRDARPENKSMASSILGRLSPIDEHKFVGKSIRKIIAKKTEPDGEPESVVDHEPAPKETLFY